MWVAKAQMVTSKNALSSASLMAFETLLKGAFGMMDLTGAYHISSAI